MLRQLINKFKKKPTVEIDFSKCFTNDPYLLEQTKNLTEEEWNNPNVMKYTDLSSINPKKVFKCADLSGVNLDELTGRNKQLKGND